MEKIFKKLTYTVMAIAIMFIFIISYVGGGVGVTYAATSSSEVLADLRKDPDFDETEYPYVKDDYGLHVIQIGESSNKELFVYVYQPCHDTYDLKGTKISISYGYSLNGSGLSPNLYNLSLVSTSGTLDKYYVEGFTVPNDGDRYYNIVEIFRIIDTEIDGEQDPTNPKTDKAYPVGQQWYVCDLNDSKHYEMNTFNTLEVETVHSGNLTFSDGFTLSDFISRDYPVDCWFYCFNIEDYIATRIYDATLNYSICDVEEIRFPSGNSNFNKSNYNYNLTIQLNNKEDKIDVMTFVPSGFGAPSFSWYRILSSSSFISTAEKQGATIDSTVREKILSSQWVFTFLETKRTNIYGPTKDTFYYSEVYDVGLLQLSFQDISGKYYDLGVVNDLSDPDNISDGGSTTDLLKAFEEFWNMFVKIILALAGVALIVLLLNFAGPVKVVLQYIFKAIGFVICLPFNLLKKLFKKDG